MNDRPIAITLFGAFISLSLAITWWAARRTHSRREFYSAGGELSGFQNGLAIAGDYTSAATFLGVTGLVYSSGFDGLIYAVGFLMAWPLILFLIAEPLRNLGRYTFADVTSYRLSALPMRGFATISTLVIVICYLITQDGGRWESGANAFWYHLPAGSAAGRSVDDALRSFWRNARNHLGSDYQSGAAAFWNHPDGRPDLFSIWL